MRDALRFLPVIVLDGLEGRSIRRRASFLVAPFCFDSANVKEPKALLGELS